MGCRFGVKFVWVFFLWIYWGMGLKVGVIWVGCVCVVGWIGCVVLV